MITGVVNANLEATIPLKVVGPSGQSPNYCAGYRYGLQWRTYFTACYDTGAWPATGRIPRSHAWGHQPPNIRLLQRGSGMGWNASSCARPLHRRRSAHRNGTAARLQDGSGFYCQWRSYPASYSVNSLPRKVLKKLFGMK